MWAAGTFGEPRVSASLQMRKGRHGDHSKHSIQINKDADGADSVTHFLIVLGKFPNISELYFL